MTRRVEAGPVLVTLGALLLLASLFLDWYEPGISAWEAFEVWDIVLLVLAVGLHRRRDRARGARSRRRGPALAAVDGRGGDADRASRRSSTRRPRPRGRTPSWAASSPSSPRW